MIIKVCGMREAENIRAVESTGVDWMGFIFYPKSSRFVDSVPEYLPTECKRVGVFVNEPAERVEELAGRFKLDFVQLHGGESPQMCLRLKQKGLGVIKVFSVASKEDLEAVEAYRDSADYLLFDTSCAGYGGSGKSFNWQILENYTLDLPFILSGGLSMDSLAELKTFKHPQWAGVDLNSCFERSPACKDVQLLTSFIEQFKN